jgi:hypothetical protein
LVLLRGEVGSARADEFCATARTRYPLVTSFMSALELQAHLEAMSAPEAGAPPAADEGEETSVAV